MENTVNLDINLVLEEYDRRLAQANRALILATCKIAELEKQLQDLQQTIQQQQENKSE